MPFFKIGVINIISSFQITGRGLVIEGDCLEGQVDKEDFLKILVDGLSYQLKIKGIDFILKENRRKETIGLTFDLTTIQNNIFSTPNIISPQRADILRESL